MTKFKLLATLPVVALLSLTAPGHAQKQPDSHHPDQPAGETDAGQQSQGQQDIMMSMMAGMMKMMSGGMTGQTGPDMQSMDMTQHAEGRIAFLRAELNITDKQAKQWDDFAEALRSNAKGMTDAGMPMMGPDAKPDLAGRLDAQERILSAKLEGLKAMKAALAPLYAALDETQRKSAEELFSAHMGLGSGGMMQGGTDSMMQGGMMQGDKDNMMQGGKMPGQSSGQ